MSDFQNQVYWQVVLKVGVFNNGQSMTGVCNRTDTGRTNTL